MKERQGDAMGLTNKQKKRPLLVPQESEMEFPDSDKFKKEVKVVNLSCSPRETLSMFHKSGPSPATKFPRVVVGLQVLSYVLLSVLTMGPLLAFELVRLEAPVGLWDHVESVRFESEKYVNMIRSIKLDSTLNLENLIPKSLSNPWSNSAGGSYDEEGDQDKDDAISNKGNGEDDDEYDEDDDNQLCKYFNGFVPEWVPETSSMGAVGIQRNQVCSLQDGFGVPENTYQAPWFRDPFTDRFRAEELAMRSQIQKMAHEALSKVRTATCIPKICSSNTGFYDPEVDIRKMFLVSFPGSGNTYLRAILRAGTRKFTGSLYNDKRLATFQGFQGEPLHPLDPKTSFVKSHFPLWKAGSPNKQRKFMGAILVVRSPFDAILAELNRIYSGQSHVGVASDAYLLGEGLYRAKALSKKFHEFIHFWEGLNGYDVLTNKVISNDGVGALDYNGTRLRDMKQIFSYDVRPMRYGQGFPVLTMFYEDFQTNLPKALAHLFAYIKIILGDQSPPVEDSVLCALHKEKVFKTTKRNSTKTVNPFVNHAKQFCEIFSFTWNENKWGPCKGRLQRERKSPTRSMFDIPEHICEM